MKPISVFLVDDNVTFLRIAARFLRGHREIAIVGTASSGEEALEQVSDLRPEVILLDLNMPGLSGFELIPRLRQLLPRAGIVALTLLGTDDYRQAALASGAHAFVSKEALSHDLVPVIREVAHGVRA